MRRAVGTALALTALTTTAASATADDIDPVRLTVAAPAAARIGAPIAVSVAVAADPGALDPRVGTLHVGVRLAPICGGSFATTGGAITPIDAAPAPQPVAGAAYSATVRGSASSGSAGELTVCTYAYDDEGRQFATDTDSVVEVNATGVPGGGGAGGGSTGSGSGSGSACRATVSAATYRVHRKRSVLLRYRACAKGRYRFVLLHGQRAAKSKTIKITKTGRRTTRLALGRKLKAGTYKVVVVLPDGKHVNAGKALRVIR